MVNYIATSEPCFFIMLRERKPITLTTMQYDTIDIEGNLVATGKL